MVKYKDFTPIHGQIQKNYIGKALFSVNLHPLMVTKASEDIYRAFYCFHSLKMVPFQRFGMTTELFVKGSHQRFPHTSGVVAQLA
jgi:hypothetical protein